MTDRIPEIVLRLAREQLAAEGGTAGARSSGLDVIAPDDVAREDLSGKPGELSGSAISADSRDSDAESAATMTFSPDLLNHVLRSGGNAAGPAVHSANNSPEVHETRSAAAQALPEQMPSQIDLPLTPTMGSQRDVAGGDADSTTSDWRADASAIVPRDPPGPPWPRGEDAAPEAAPFVLNDAVPPAEHFDTDAGDRGLPFLVETIADHGRRFEEVLSDLEQSLTALFTTQIETLQRLRDQARDHDRRWAEQSANRRTVFSPP